MRRRINAAGEAGDHQPTAIGQRAATTVAPQALFLMNHPFVIEAGEARIRVTGTRFDVNLLGVMYGSAALVKSAKKKFPASLAEVPVLLPTGHTAVRTRLDHWFEHHAIQPRIVGEFEDSALLKTFGESGMGVFPAAEWVHDELLAHYDVQRLGPCEGVKENFFAIGTEKKVQHPLVQRLLQASVSAH